MFLVMDHATHTPTPAPFFLASINGNQSVRSDLIAGFEIRSNPSNSKRTVVAIPMGTGPGIVVWQSRAPKPNNDLDATVIEQAARRALDRITALVIGCPPVSVLDIHAEVMA